MLFDDEVTFFIADNMPCKEATIILHWMQIDYCTMARMRMYWETSDDTHHTAVAPAMSGSILTSCQLEHR